MKLKPNHTVQDPQVAPSAVRAGQTRGLLTVIAKQGRQAWLCHCTCGRLVVRSTTYLLNNPVPQCGCRRVLTEEEVADYAGQTRGRFTAMRHDPVKRVDAQGYPVWLCRCVCGQVVRMNVHDFLDVHYESCGCIKRLRGLSLGTRPRLRYPRPHKPPTQPQSRHRDKDQS